MTTFLDDVTHEFCRHKKMADRAMGGMDDAAFFHRPGEAVNPVALIVKHLAGNLASRWHDFLTSDGEKPDRDRDREFILTPADTRASLMAAWETGWNTLLATLDTLTPDDLPRTITIRSEPLSVTQALVRGSCHAAYHVGQILYLSRLLNPGGEWLTIAPGASFGLLGQYNRSRPAAPRQEGRPRG